MAARQTRARFIGASAATIGGAALAGAWRTPGAAAAGAAATAKIVEGATTEGAFDARFYGDRFSFELDGISAGAISSVEGGGATSDVVNEKMGPDHIVHKHLAGVKYEDLAITCGTGMSKGFYEWIKASFDKGYVRKNGAVVAGDFNGKVTARGEFTNGLITEIGFPALDGSSKDAANMSIKFTPELTRLGDTKGGGASIPPGGGSIPQLSAGVFKLDIDGLSTQKISKIESFTVKQGILINSDGSPDPVNTLDIGNLAFSFDGGIDQSWIDYFEDFVVKGNNGPANERNGVLTLMDKKSTPMFMLAFSNLGIFRLTPEKVVMGSGNIRRIKAEMYCEDIRFTYSSAATFG